MFADGSVSIFVVPDPEDLASETSDKPVYGETESLHQEMMLMTQESAAKATATN